MSRRPIDFSRLRELISPRQVWELLAWPRQPGWHYAWRGPCPAHGCSSRQSRVCTSNHQVAFCHRCRRTWDAAGIYACVRALPTYEAAVELCDRLSIDVPYIDR